MLMLSRKRGERIQIDDTIEVTVLQISGNRVQIGISAPPDVSIRRKELARRDRSTGTERTVVAERAAG